MIVAIIQARMGSRRLPGKVLAEIVGKPLLAHVVERTRRARAVDLVVVATSKSPGDDPIADFCTREGIPCFRGEEDDVLDRFYRCACRYKATIVVRITADCPLIDPAVIDRVVERYQVGDCDFAANCLRYTYPHGLDVEVFGFDVLERAWREATSPTHREHVTDFIRTHPQMRCVNVENPVDLQGEEHRWTVDHPCDLEFVRAVYGHLGVRGEHFSMLDVLELVNRKPELRRINAGEVRHDGYYHTILDEVRRSGVALPLDAKSSLRDSDIVNYIETGVLAGPVLAEGGRIRTPRRDYVDLWLRSGGVVVGHSCSSRAAVPSRAAADSQRALEERIAAMYRPGPAAALTGELESAWKSLWRRLAERFRHVFLLRSGFAVGRHTLEDYPNVCHVSVDEGETWKERLTGKLSVLDALIVDPVGLEKEQLQTVGRLAEAAGVLILDETQTWLRLSPTGAAGWARIDAGAAVVGRTLGNGESIVAIVGEAAIIDGMLLPRPSPQSVAAAHAVLDAAEEQPLAAQMWEQGRKIQDGFNVMAEELGIAKRVALVGAAPATILHCETSSIRRALSTNLMDVEIAAGDRVFSCFAHGEADVELTLRGFASALLRLACWMSDGHHLGDAA